MKILITLILIAGCLQAVAQKTEDEKKLVAAMTTRSDSARLQTIQLNLYRFSKQYNIGTGVIGVGLALSAIGTAMLLKDNSQDGDLPTAILIGGGALVTVGWVIHVDSHKFMKRASGIKK